LHCRKIWPDIVDSDDSEVENEIDVDKLPPLEVGPNENRLQHTYCLWFSRKGTQRAATDYSKSLHVVGRCASVQQWWSLYSHLIRPTSLKPYRELSLFKQGIKPMWEDPANSKGGQWLIRLRKNKIERAWENVCMAMLGEQFLVGDEICGIVLQTKYPVSSANFHIIPFPWSNFYPESHHNSKSAPFCSVAKRLQLQHFDILSIDKLIALLYIIYTKFLFRIYSPFGEFCTC